MHVLVLRRERLRTARAARSAAGWWPRCSSPPGRPREVKCSRTAWTSSRPGSRHRPRPRSRPARRRFRTVMAALALPRADQQRPHRAVGEAGGRRADRGQRRRGLRPRWRCRARAPPGSTLRKSPRDGAPAPSGSMRPATSVPSGSRRRPARRARQPGAGAHVAARRAEHADDQPHHVGDAASAGSALTPRRS